MCFGLWTIAENIERGKQVRKLLVELSFDFGMIYLTLFLVLKLLFF